MANTHSLDLERGSSQCATIADASQTGLDFADDFTIECWLNFESVPGGGTLYTFLSHDDFAVSRGWYFGLFDNAGTLQLRQLLYDGASNFPAVAWTPSTATWYHVAVTRQKSSGDVKFYVNGSQQGATVTSTTNSISNSTVPVRLGAVGDTSANANFFDGKMDDVRVWTVVRTQAEIDANKSVELAGNESNLVAYWRLNNDYLDMTANNNDLTAANSPVFSTDIPFSPPVKTYNSLDIDSVKTINGLAFADTA